MHHLAEGFVFEGNDQGFLKGGVKTYLVAPISPLDSPTFAVFTSVVYGMVHYKERSKLRFHEI
jgi:hypothetical protein